MERGSQRSLQTRKRNRIGIAMVSLSLLSAQSPKQFKDGTLVFSNRPEDFWNVPSSDSIRASAYI